MICESSRDGRGRRRPGRDRGAITVFVLVCLVIITAICGVLLRIGLAERRRIRAEERRLQAEWLVESGLERGASRLDDSPGGYRGETWDIPAVDMGGPDPARVIITVEPVEKEPSRRNLRVQAEYPRDATERARVSRRVTVAIDTNSPGGAP